MPARVSFERRRGCGWRKLGGLYLRGAPLPHHCGKLPLRVHRCPTCGAGIKPSRGWTWIDPMALFKNAKCRRGEQCPEDCLLRIPAGMDMGLLWVGNMFYPTVERFTEEASKQGISRRIARVPRGFELRKTYVALAHIRAYKEACPLVTEPDHDEQCELCKGTGVIGLPGIFAIFQPEFLEKVVDPTTPEEELEKLRARHIDPVIVKREDESGTPQLPGAEE